MNHPGWQGFGYEGPRYLQTSCVSFQFLREDCNLAQVIGNCLGNISEMILYEGFIAHGIRVGGVLTQCLTQNDKAPGVFHLGLELFEAGVLGDLVPIWRPKLRFLGLWAETRIMDCPGQGLKNLCNVIGRAD